MSSRITILEAIATAIGRTDKNMNMQEDIDMRNAEIVDLRNT